MTAETLRLPRLHPAQAVAAPRRHRRDRRRIPPPHGGGRRSSPHDLHADAPCRVWFSSKSSRTRTSAAISPAPGARANSRRTGSRPRSPRPASPSTARAARCAACISSARRTTRRSSCAAPAARSSTWRVDLRPQSPTCGQWQGFELTADNAAALYVPSGLRPRLPDARARQRGLLPDLGLLRARSGGGRCATTTPPSPWNGRFPSPASRDLAGP